MSRYFENAAAAEVGDLIVFDVRRETGGKSYTGPCLDGRKEVTGEAVEVAGPTAAVRNENRGRCFVRRHLIRMRVKRVDVIVRDASTAVTDQETARELLLGVIAENMTVDSLTGKPGVGLSYAENCPSSHWMQFEAIVQHGLQRGWFQPLAGT